ncbi:hypothetical protein BGW37DRAFT_479329 [Umbelopsis sp. PMI_123]|nr:hypothetical protein BGW37DRAFT_479329 [Umbelopsis sp. PMI_123]
MKEKKHPSDEKSRHLASATQHRRQMSGMDQPVFHGIQINIRSDPFQHRIPSHLNRLWQESRFRKAISRSRYRALRRYHRLTYAQRIATILGLILCCLLLLSHVGFFSGQKFDNLHHETHDNPSPPPSLGEIDLLEKVYPEDGRGQATAILLNWSRLENMKIIIDHLCQYDMFQNIMVWNNNGAVNLTSTMLATPSCPSSKILIYNSPGNMHFIARYMACAMAQTPYCYFQDDDWIIQHLRSMYANFLRSPHLVHTDTNADVYSLTNWKWCFFNKPIDLHTCFSWVGTGAFASRETVVKFLKLAAVTDMDPLEFAYGDMYFTTYMNQPPYQIQNDLRELPQENAFSAGDGRIRNKIYMHKALARMMDHLKSDSDVFQRSEVSPTLYERDIRAPCHDDRCLMMTNKHAFPDVRLFLYNPAVNISESERIHDEYYNSDYFIAHPYSHAVDGNDNTAWRTLNNIQAKDYFGLDLLLPIPVPVMYRLVVDQPFEYFANTAIQTSINGKTWTNLDPKPRISCEPFNDANDHLLTLCKFHVPTTKYRFIRLQTQRDLDFPYVVADFSFSARARRDANGQLLGLDNEDDGTAFLEDYFEKDDNNGRYGHEASEQSEAEERQNR